MGKVQRSIESQEKLAEIRFTQPDPPHPVYQPSFHFASNYNRNMMFRSISLTLLLHPIVSFINIINPHLYSLLSTGHIHIVTRTIFPLCNRLLYLDLPVKAYPRVPNTITATKAVRYKSPLFNTDHLLPKPTGHHHLKYPTLALHYFDADPSHTPQTLLCSIPCCALAQSATTSICRHHR